MTTASEQILAGLRGYREAWSVIHRNSLGKYFVIPIIVNIVLVVLLLWAGSGLGDWVTSLWDTSQGGWLSYLGTAVRWIMPVLFFLLFILIGGSITIMLMSPVYTMISEKTDTAITGRTFGATASQTASDIWRAVLISLRNTVKQLLITILCLLLNVIPFVGQILSLVLIFIVNAYYFGYSFMDYTNERYRRNVSESNANVWRYKYLAITIGAVYALPMYMFCGTFVAAFLGGISTVAATVAQIEIESKDAN